MYTADTRRDKGVLGWVAKTRIIFTVFVLCQLDLTGGDNTKIDLMPVSDLSCFEQPCPVLQNLSLTCRKPDD
jgi:hypothetical protein